MLALSYHYCLPLPPVIQPIETLSVQYQPRLRKEKPNELLTVSEVKKMIYKEIEKKKKRVDPDKFNTRIVEDSLAEVEAMQQIHAMILDEELRRKREMDMKQSKIVSGLD